MTTDDCPQDQPQGQPDEEWPLLIDDSSSYDEFGAGFLGPNDMFFLDPDVQEFLRTLDLSGDRDDDYIAAIESFDWEEIRC